MNNALRALTDTQEPHFEISTPFNFQHINHVVVSPSGEYEV